MKQKVFRGSINIELENTEYIVEFKAYPFVLATHSSPAEGGDWEVTEVRYANPDKWREQFAFVADVLWKPLETKYQHDLTCAIKDRIAEVEQGYE